MVPIKREEPLCQYGVVRKLRRRYGSLRMPPGQVGNEHLGANEQWFILTPVSKPTGAVSKVAGQVLLAAQNESVKTRTAAMKKAFKNHRLVKRFFKNDEEKTLEKRGVVTSGTFYIIASDHLIDQVPKALSSGTTSMGGATEGALAPWKNGETSQQWKITRA